MNNAELSEPRAPVSRCLDWLTTGAQHAVDIDLFAQRRALPGPPPANGHASI